MAGNKPESKKSARQKAAAAREAQLAQERRKERLTRILIGVVSAVIVIVIIGGAVMYSKSNSSSNGKVAPDSSHALPKTVIPETYAIPFKTGAKSDLPLVQVWQDPQCPACASFANGGVEKVLEKAATDNKIDLQFRPTTFLDIMLGNDSSARAVSAWGCAIDQGRGNQYQDVMFASQPEEGKGYSQQDLISFGSKAGIQGEALNTYTQCVTNNTYLGWAANSTEKYNEEGVKGTPAVYVNGKEFPLTGITPDNFLSKIEEAAKQQ